MVFLAVNWRVWVVLGLLFLYALARRLFRSWRLKRRARLASYESKRP